MIKYCCYYCRKLNTKECSRGCYNALGGKGYMDVCKIKDGDCAESFNAGKGKRMPVIEANKDCWEGVG